MNDLIKIQVTGDLRSIANAAWISTTDQKKAEERSYEDVKRVTSFLAKNAHTSPFESVTVSLFIKDFKYEKMIEFKDILSGSRFGKFVKTRLVSDSVCLTTDLLNFYKIIRLLGENNEIWTRFSFENPDMAERLELIPLRYGSDLGLEENAEDVSENFLHSNIEVEIVSVHSPIKDKSCDRITWRVKCPLSIGVQMLRHRTGSFNMVSGRYKTIRQEFTTTSNDLIKIFDKADILGLDKQLREKAEETREFYLEFMKSLAKLKKEDVISNEEYKRCREYVRFILPEGRMTELYITFYKEDFDHFLKLRNSSHTQPEHIYVAQLMKKTYENYCRS